MSVKATFLDRDGVLVASRVVEGKPFSARTVDELELLPGAETACALLRDHGFELIVVTNQPEVSRGTLDPQVVAAMNSWLCDQLSLDLVMVCPHDDADGCNCRKPLPGMLLDAEQDRNVDLAQSVMVGDRWRDIAAGIAAGTHTVFVDHGYDERQPEAMDATVHTVLEAAQWITQNL